MTDLSKMTSISQLSLGVKTRGFQGLKLLPDDEMAFFPLSFGGGKNSFWLSSKVKGFVALICKNS